MISGHIFLDTIQTPLYNYTVFPFFILLLYTLFSFLFFSFSFPCNWFAAPRPPYLQNGGHSFSSSLWSSQLIQHKRANQIWEPFISSLSHCLLSPSPKRSANQVVLSEDVDGGWPYLNRGCRRRWRSRSEQKMKGCLLMRTMVVVRMEGRWRGWRWWVWRYRSDEDEGKVTIKKERERWEWVGVWGFVKTAPVLWVKCPNCP